jgi:hypothetical protein
MEKLPDTFAVFILTHGRPDNVITAKTLQKCGYTGKLFFIVDNEDKTVDRYIENFGRERVMIFHKKEVADTCDEGNNFDNRSVIVHARNASFEIAKTLGISEFLQLDDDYYELNYRFPDTPPSTTTKNIDKVLVSMLGFYRSTNARAIAFSQMGDFIGGLDNGKKAYRFSKRKCMNSFLCSTSREFRFIGSINEDVNTYTTLGSRGDLFLTIPVFAINQKDSQKQKGGMTDHYKQQGTYIKSFSTVMMHPSGVRAAMMNANHKRVHHSIDWKATVPCIIRETHRKTRLTT